jgi:hypothetical protein
VTADAMRVHAAMVDQRARQVAVAARFVTAHPGVPLVEVPVQAADVHDLDGLRAIGHALGRRSRGHTEKTGYREPGVGGP